MKGQGIVGPVSIEPVLLFVFLNHVSSPKTATLRSALMLFQLDVGRGLFEFFSRATLRQESKVLALVLIGTINRWSSKSRAQPGVSWCYRAIRRDTLFISRVLLTVKHSFWASLQGVGKILEKQPFHFFTDTTGIGAMDRKYRKVRIWAEKIR